MDPLIDACAAHAAPTSSQPRLRPGPGSAPVSINHPKINRQWTWPITWCLVLLLTSSAFAQQDQVTFINGLYQEYYQRFPNQTELNEWLGWFQRGASYTDLHASFIASDEYFNKHNRNTTSWLNGAFATVNNRNPRPDELNYWALRLNQLGNDRRRLAVEFLRTYGGSRPPAAGQPSIGFQPTDTTASLVTTAQLLSQSVDREFYGLQQRMMKLQANNLVTIANASREPINTASRDPARAWTAYRNLTAAMSAINQNLSSAFGARETRLYASQIDQILRSIEASLPPAVADTGQPVFPSYPPSNGIGQAKFRQLVQQSDRLNLEATDINYLVGSLASYDYRWRQLSSDLEAFAGEVDHFRRNLSPNSVQASVEGDARQLRRSARRINRDLPAAPMDIRVSQAWQEVNVSLGDLLTALGIAGGAQGGAQLPAQPDIDRRTAAIQAIDEAIAACDALDHAFVPYRLYGAGVSQFLAELRNLRNGLTLKRQGVLTNPNLQNVHLDLQDLAPTVARLNERWLSVIYVTGTGMSPLYQNLANAMQRVYRVLE